MTDKSTGKGALEAMRRINRTWLTGDVEALVPLVHSDVVMVFPDFTGRIQGREAFLDGFRDFCQNTKIVDFRERNLEADVAGDTAAVTFQYDMVYERDAKQYRANGRDLWVFQKQANLWIVVWRAMLNMDEVPV